MFGECENESNKIKLDKEEKSSFANNDEGSA
jgi:hypothetical protein